MRDERKPLWPWIAVLLIGLPVLYVASFGPVCWLTADPRPISPLRSSTAPRGMIVYYPLGRVAMRGPAVVMYRLRWWMYLGAKNGFTVSVPTDLDGNCFSFSETSP